MSLPMRGDFIEEIHIHCQPDWLIATLAKFEVTAIAQGILST
jgi:hypothetical protein